MPSRAGGLWEKLKQGFAYVYRHPSMSSLVLLVAIGSLLAIPYLTFVPYFARDVLGSDEPGLGVLMACSGAGAFLGAITIASLTHIRRRGLFVSALWPDSMPPSSPSPSRATSISPDCCSPSPATA